MSRKTKGDPPRRQLHLDGAGRIWQVAVVACSDADAEDARFWLDELTPAQRVMAVEECTRSALLARGFVDVPRLRRVARIVERRAR
jgi:hypothetical protein